MSELNRQAVFKYSMVSAVLFAVALLISMPGLAEAGEEGKEDEQGGKAEEAANPDQPPRTGKFEIEREGVPAGRYVEIMRSVKAEPNPEYFRKLEEGPDTLMSWSDKGSPKWSVHVPPGYEPGQPPGVLVYINSGKNAKNAKTWREVTSKRNLICIAPYYAGNNTPTVGRMVAGISGIDLLKKTYELDSDRIYVSGVSGGGRVASIMMWFRADLFTGGYPHAGANHIKSVHPKHGTIRGVPRRMIALAKRRGRYAFYVGENDFNQPPTKAIVKDMTERGFRALYLEQPGQGHTGPGDEWMEKGLAFLDKPLKEQARESFEEAGELENDGRKFAAIKAYRAAVLHSFGEDFGATAKEKAESLSRAYEVDKAAIRKLFEDGSWDEARKRLGKFAREWGRAAADDQRKLRREMIKARRKALRSES